MNKLTSEMGDFFTDAMRDSNSHEFEEIVDPITCMPNEELEESLNCRIIVIFQLTHLTSDDRDITD